jgi:hypothetical protein
MTMNRVRFGILGIFVVFMLVQIAAFSAVSDRIWPEELESLIAKLLAIYAVHIGVILGGIFSQPRRHLEPPASALAWTAILLAIAWNMLLTWRSVSFSRASQDSVAGLLKYLDTVASASSFLVAAVLTAFFTKGTKTT